MKKISRILFVLALSAITFYACSDDTTEPSVDNVDFRTKSGGVTFSPGDQIAVWNSTTGSWQFTVSQNDLVVHFEEFWRDQGYTYNLDSVIIDEHVDAYGTSYALICKNNGNTIKVGTIIEKIPAGGAQTLPVLRLMASLSDFQAGVSCTSTQCPYSCNPGQIRNPSTGKYILGCTPCANTCTKTGSL